jgi:hypothetical protein
MFVNHNADWPPQPEPPQPPPPRPHLDRRAEARIGWVIALNLLMLLIAPLAGITLFDAARALFGG